MQAKYRVQLAGDDQLEEGELVGIRAKREDALVLSVLVEKLGFDSGRTEGLRRGLSARRKPRVGNEGVNALRLV